MSLLNIITSSGMIFEYKLYFRRKIVCWLQASGLKLQASGIQCNHSKMIFLEIPRGG